MLGKLMTTIVLLVCALAPPVLLVIINPESNVFIFLMVVLGLFSLGIVTATIIKCWKE